MKIKDNVRKADRRKEEQEKNAVINKDFITWLVCVVSSIGLLILLLLVSYMKG